jgi:cyclopropane-fatty-acyl-phospholipid synthase
VRDQIFGWGELIPLSAYVEHLEEAGFSLRGLTDLTSHYARTIDAWQQNVQRNRDALEDLQPGVTEQLLRYFEISNAAWGFSTKQYAVVACKCR